MVSHAVEMLYSTDWDHMGGLASFPGSTYIGAMVSAWNLNDSGRLRQESCEPETS